MKEIIMIISMLFVFIFCYMIMMMVDALIEETMDEEDFFDEEYDFVDFDD